MVAAPEQPDGLAEVSARTDEEVRVHDWAEEMYLDMGYPAAAALELADAHVDWHEIQKLISRGCSLKLASELLRP